MDKSDIDLSGMAAFVTGGGGGIGRAAALCLADMGADVAIVDVIPERCEQMIAEIEKRGRKALALPVNVMDVEALQHAVQAAADTFGRLDVLVNNAGYQMARRESMADVTTEDLDRVLRTNLYAMFWLTQAALEHLSDGASIINTSSIQAYQPSTGLIDYAATKAAINNFTVNLAAELGARGIRVNAVAPGPIWTPLQPATQPPEKIEQFGSDTPLGRAGQPAEVAPAFVFLASTGDASYVSGTVLGVTGGKPVF